MTETRDMSLERTITDIVVTYGINPDSRVGRKFKLKLIELYEKVPPGFEGEVELRVLHDPKCACMGERPGDCSCDPDVKAKFSGIQGSMVH